jgi:hypothetical protein
MTPTARPMVATEISSAARDAVTPSSAEICGSTAWGA